MEDYFEKSITNYAARIGQALNSIPRDLCDEQLVLATKCSDRLNESQTKLAALALSLRTIAHSDNDARLREFQRIVRDIEYVETVGLAALERSNEVDEKLNRLVKQIRKEISYPLPLPPVVTATSKDYFYVHTRFNFNLICIPPGEKNSLLHLPDLYHELAHPLITEKNVAKIQPFQFGLSQIRDLVFLYFTTEIVHRSRQRGPGSYQKQAEIWLQRWYQSWATEFICDLYAVYTLGPAFVWSHYNLCAKKTDNPFETGLNISPTHPADEARMYLMLLALDRIGFTEIANKIDDRWKEFVISAAYSKDIEYSQCYPKKLLDRIEEIAYEAVLNAKSRIATPTTSDYVHCVLNNAWEKFWEDRESYVEWEFQEIERLYSYCARGVNDSGSIKELSDPKKMETSDSQMNRKVEVRLPEVKSIFINSLTELKRSLSRSSQFIAEFPFLGSEDIRNLQLEFKASPRGGIYDHVRFERIFYLSGELLNFYGSYWNLYNINDDHKKRMCKLFFLHEFLHIHQHVDSNTYPYSKNSKNSFQYIDYDADAFAVRASLETELSYLPWNQHLVEILIAHIRGGEVFALADDRQSSGSMEGGRLHRQAIWCLQYARARAFLSESNFGVFYIDRHIIIEIFAIQPDGARENLCLKDVVSLTDFTHIIEIHISWAGIRYRYSLTTRHSIDSFAKGVFNCDFDSISEAFRPLFDTNPELTGRLSISGSTLPSNSEFERIEFIQKLRSLHTDDLGQIIISIPGAAQMVSTNETNAKKLEQLISWAESSSGPSIEKIYEVSKKLYPNNF